MANSETIRVARNALLIFGLVAAFALFGILTRPTGFLAALWPANAVLLGTMVRFPSLSTVASWIAAAAGFICADLLTGNAISSAVLLASANLTGIVAGYGLFMRLKPETRRLQRASSPAALACVSLVAGLFTSLPGAGVSAIVYGREYFPALALWLSSEVTNHLTIMPFILTLPQDWKTWRSDNRSSSQHMERKRSINRFVSLLLLAVACGASMTIGGPGAIVFPVPVLLWIALSFSLFSTSLIVTAYVIWCQAATTAGMINIGSDLHLVHNMVSLRLGIALLALGPLAVASINVSRDALLRAMEKSANHDALTGTLARSAFMRRSERMTQQCSAPYAVMMLDIDHFKAINDRFGHDGGDEALVTFCHAIGTLLKRAELFGRLGGEEFAILAHDLDHDSALRLGEELRRSIETTQVSLSGIAINLTVSIGLVTCAHGEPRDIRVLLKKADESLYLAKKAGRNRLEMVQI